MKKLTPAILATILLFASCKRSDVNEQLPPEENTTEMVSQRACASHEVLEAQLAADPARRERLEAFKETAKKFKMENTGRIVNGVLEIPVVVNVLYRTAAENVSMAQINSQIEVLNKDFTYQNTDRDKLANNTFDNGAPMNVRFVLAKVQTKPTKKSSWSTNDDMKRASTGGIDAYLPATHLNIWVVGKMQQYGQTILGYAQFPDGPLATDGVVIGYKYFGTGGTTVAPYNLGRTATHEVGHWMGLYHIWGDATCGSDGISDTPQHNGPNYGCPTYPHLSTCSSKEVEMTMNYMDYTYDACMYMFTAGQVTNMNATFFANGAPRVSFTAAP